MKRSYLSILIILGITFTLPGSGDEVTKAPDKSGGTAVTKEVSGASDITITKEWNQAPLRDILRFIAETAKVNIIPDNEVDNSVKVTYLAVNNLNWRDVLAEAVRQSRCETEKKAYYEVEEIKPNYFRVYKMSLISLTTEQPGQGQPESTIVDIITTIARAGKVNIILPSDISAQKIKVAFEDVPWTDALQYVCKTAGLIVVKEAHNVYRIAKPADLATQMETRIFQLKYLRPPSDYRAKIDTTYAVGTAKAPDATKEFTVLDILENMLSKPGGMLKFDAKTNCIIVKDTKPNLDEMEKVITQLDVEPLQILFMVNFVNTTNNDLLKFGIDYTTSSEPEGWAITTVPYLTGATAPTTTQRITHEPFGTGGMPGGGIAPDFSAAFLNKFDLTATLRMFASDVNSKLEQQPVLLTLDGKEATIWVGEEIHFAQVTVSAATGGTTQQSQISEASQNSPAKQGFQLLVIPNIIKGTNKIMMTVVPQNSLLTGAKTTTPEGFDTFSITTNGTTNSIDLPRIQTTALITHLIVDDGETAVIGGLSTERTSKTVKKIPVLGDIPIIGDALFKYTNDSAKKTHLLIYLTAKIIRKAGDTKGVLITGKEDLEKALKESGLDSIPHK